jgi:hypothetical protein
VLRVFRFLLKLPDGEPPNPAVLVTAVPTWSEHAELGEHDVRAIFTFEPA